MAAAEAEASRATREKSRPRDPTAARSTTVPIRCTVGLPAFLVSTLHALQRRKQPTVQNLQRTACFFLLLVLVLVCVSSPMHAGPGAFFSCSSTLKKRLFSTLAQSRRSRPPLCPLRLHPIPQPLALKLHAEGHRHNKHSVWPPAETQGKEGRKRGGKPSAPEPPAHVPFHRSCSSSFFYIHPPTAYAPSFAHTATAPLAPVRVPVAAAPEAATALLDRTWRKHDSKNHVLMHTPSMDETRHVVYRLT